MKLTFSHDWLSGSIDSQINTDLEAWLQNNWLITNFEQ
jgi:hypothetical protein